MKTIKELEKKREAILDRMRAIRSMNRGTINEQYLKVPHKGKKQPVLRGPYYVLSRREGNRTVSERLTDPTELERAKRDVEAHKHFVSLCREFERLTEQLGELERAAAGLEAEKNGAGRGRTGQGTDPHPRYGGKSKGNRPRSVGGGDSGRGARRRSGSIGATA